MEFKPFEYFLPRFHANEQIEKENYPLNFEFQDDFSQEMHSWMIYQKIFILRISQKKYKLKSITECLD